jgi:molybdopterin converting factor small subunit
MRVKVRLLGSLRPVNMHNTVEVELPAFSNLGTLMEKIKELYPEVASSIKRPAGSLILLNGVEAGNFEGLETPVRDGSDIIVIPITHGG